jgi:hypothetical protein
MATPREPGYKGQVINLVSEGIIQNKILFIRGKKVMLDRHIAELYGVKTIALRQQVKRNPARFPDDFMFQLTRSEAEFLVSQNVIPSLRSLGGALPYAFTEQGVAMLSSVLNSERAIHVNIVIMRTFAKLREMISTNKELATKLEKIEQKLGQHDEDIQAIIEFIKRLHSEPEEPKTEIGFQPNNADKE